MLSRTTSVGAIIVGISFVQLSNGFLGTLVSMNTAAAAFSAPVTGIILASYYAGYTIGAATIGVLLRRVGHIRLFAALAGLVGASIALQPVFISAPAWIIIRAITGIGCAGLFVAAESWLNGTSIPANRGAIFAIYMVSTNAAFGSGQFLLNIPFPGTFELYSLAAALFCLALVPVSLTRSTAPALIESPRVGLRQLRRLAPIAVFGCAASGLVSSVFYSLIPAYAQSEGTPPNLIAAYIATAVFGGLAAQVPVGKLSDLWDRRLVAAGVSADFSVTALCLALLPLNRAMIYFLTFVLGGFMSTIYPVCVAHANDQVKTCEILSTSGQLILINGTASFVGPICGTLVMGRAGIHAVFLFVALIGIAFAVLTAWRLLTVRSPEQRERPFAILSERMSQPISHVIDGAQPLSRT